MNNINERRLEVPARLPAGLEKFCRSHCRLVALGLVSGHVMHDIRNALAVVSGHAQIIQIKGDKVSHEDVIRRMEQIIEQVERILTTINQVGSFTSRASGNMADVAPDESLENAVQALERRLENAGLKVLKKWMEAPRTLRCDASLFDFVLLQLLECCIPDKRSDGELSILTSSGETGWELKLNLSSKADDDGLFSGFLKITEGFDLVAVLLSLKPMKAKLFLLSGPDHYGFRLLVPWDAGG